jgi:predicted metal-dependent enzyme (double-stranded beta helix superfamily)
MPTTTVTIPGTETLIQALDRAVGGGDDVSSITSAVQRSLSRLILDGAVSLPEEVVRPVPGHYARRLIHRSAEHGYVVVAMVWGPGQATPLHDHAGTWCVEGVYQGQIAVTQFDLEASDGDRCRFRRLDTERTGVGSAGSLIPPFEYHSIANAQDDPSVTLHVYGGEMTRCTAFEPLGEGWFERRERTLGYDA